MGRIYNKKTDYIEHLQPLIDYADNQNVNLTELFKRSDIELKRKSDFKTGRKTFTAYYFLKMLGGVSLAPQQYEAQTGMRFTDEQRKELAYQKYTEVHREKYLKAMKYPKLHKQLMALINTYEE